MDQIKNGSYSTVATAPSPATSGVTLVVAAGEGANFPTVPFNAVICPSGTLPKPSNMEIVRVTGRSTDTLTIVRAQESSVARTVVIGDQIFAALTFKWLNEQRIALSVKMFGGATGDGSTNDTTAIQATIDAVNTAGGGTVDVDPGTYICNGLTLYSNITLRGYGDVSILKQPTAVADGNHLLNVNNGSGGSADPSTNLSGIRIRDLKLQGRVDVDTFTQQVHLVNINAATRVRITNVTFYAWRGDAIYCGSGNTAAIERHNEDILVTGCTFDGLNRLNRNGISVIDGTDVRIVANHFKNCTRDDMPGAIDLEPNGVAYPRLQNISILNNTFYNVGGNGGVIVGSFQDQSAQIRPVTGIIVSGNTFRACDSNAQVMMQQFAQASATTRPHNIVISNNSMYSGDPFGTVTISNASPGVVTLSTGHNLSLNQRIQFTTTGGLPAPLAVNTTYYVVELTTTTTFKIALTRGGAAINTTTAGSGVHTLYQAWSDYVFQLHGLKAARVLGNTAYNFYDGVSLGYTYNNHDILIESNTFTGCGISTKVFQIIRAQFISFINNYVDAPTGADVFSFTIDGSAGVSDHISTLGNIVLNGTNFSAKNASHTLSQTTNLAQLNVTTLPILNAHWLAPEGWNTITKKTNQAVISNAAVQDDTDLQFPMLASRTYRIRAHIFWDTTAAGDYKYTLIGPASPTLVRTEIIVGISGGTPAFAVIGTAYPSSAGVTQAGTGTTGGFLFFDMFVQNGANAGTFKVQFCQGTSSADTGAIHLAGSYLEYSLV